MDAGDPTALRWHNLAWLHHRGPLTPDNVLEYVATSPFWDAQSSNAQVMMQTRLNPELDPALLDFTCMVGVEFSVALHRPPGLYVVLKSYRHSPGQVDPMAVYYVMDGDVFQAPDLRKIISNRILTCLSNTRMVFDDARKYSRHGIDGGYTWDFSEPSTNPSPIDTPSDQGEMEAHDDQEDAELAEIWRRGMNAALAKAYDSAIRSHTAVATQVNASGASGMVRPKLTVASVQVSTAATGEPEQPRLLLPGSAPGSIRSTGTRKGRSKAGAAAPVSARIGAASTDVGSPGVAESVASRRKKKRKS